MITAKGYAGLIVLAVVAIGGLYYFMPGIFQGGQTASIGQQPTTPFTPSVQVPGTTYQGNFDMNYVVSNAGNASSLTDATQVKINYYKQNADGTYNFLGQSASNTKRIGVDPSINTVWAEVVHQTSQPYFTNWQKTVADNGGCTAGKGKVCNPSFLDLDKNNINSYVFPIDITPFKANADPALLPAINWQLLLDADQQALFNSPADQTSIGTGSIQNTIEWQLNFDHQPGTERVTAFQIRINDTDDTKWNTLKSYLLINNQQFTLADMSSYKDTSNTRTVYEKKFGTDVNTSFIVGVDAVGVKNVKAPFIWYTNLASGDDMCIEIEATKVSALGAYTETTDDVEMTNDANTGSGGSFACSITDD